MVAASQKNSGTDPGTNANSETTEPSTKYRIVLATLILIALCSGASLSGVLPSFVPEYTNWHQGTCLVTSYWSTMEKGDNYCTNEKETNPYNTTTTGWWLRVDFTYTNGTAYKMPGSPAMSLYYITPCISVNVTRPQLMEKYNNTRCQMLVPNYFESIRYSGYPPFYWLISPIIFGVSLIALLVFSIVGCVTYRTRSHNTMVDYQRRTNGSV